MLAHQWVLIRGFPIVTTVFRQCQHVTCTVAWIKNGKWGPDISQREENELSLQSHRPAENRACSEYLCFNLTSFPFRAICRCPFHSRTSTCILHTDHLLDVVPVTLAFYPCCLYLVSGRWVLCTQLEEPQPFSQHNTLFSLSVIKVHLASKYKVHCWAKNRRRRGGGEEERKRKREGEETSTHSVARSEKRLV